MKSEATACARRYRSSRLTGWWIRKELSGKMEGPGGEEAQGVADPPKTLLSITYITWCGANENRKYRCLSHTTKDTIAVRRFLIAQGCQIFVGPT
jgi:hypothetical protein